MSCHERRFSGQVMPDAHAQSAIHSLLGGQVPTGPFSAVQPTRLARILSLSAENSNAHLELGMPISTGYLTDFVFAGQPRCAEHTLPLPPTPMFLPASVDSVARKNSVGMTAFIRVHRRFRNRDSCLVACGPFALILDD